VRVVEQHVPGGEVVISLLPLVHAPAKAAEAELSPVAVVSVEALAEQGCIGLVSLDRRPLAQTGQHPDGLAIGARVATGLALVVESHPDQ
jgi:hypothetical protein